MVDRTASTGQDMRARGRTREHGDTRPTPCRWGSSTHVSLCMCGCWEFVVSFFNLWSYLLCNENTF